MQGLSEACRCRLRRWLIAGLTLVAVPGVATAEIGSAGIPFSMVVMTMPMLPVRSLFGPTAMGVALGGFLYLYVMPHYTSFLALGPLIFIFTFVVCYRYYEPRDMLKRAFGLAMFVAIAGIDNEQSYSFYAFSTTALLLALAYFVFWFIRELPFTSRPEAVMLGYLRRFFGSAGALLSAALEDPKTRSPGEHGRQMRQHRDLKTIPMKMTAWGRFLNTGILPGTTPEQVSELPGKLRVLAGRLEEVLANLRTDQAPELVDALQADFRSWRLAIVDVLSALAADPGAPALADLNQRLQRHLSAMENRVTDAFEALGPEILTETQARNFYQLMGSFRGLSEALVDFRAFAGDIDWAPWREARFA